MERVASVERRSNRKLGGYDSQADLNFPFADDASGGDGKHFAPVLVPAVHSSLGAWAHHCDYTVGTDLQR